MEKWQIRKAYYLHAWVVAIAVFIGLNGLLFNSPTYKLFTFAYLATDGMLLIFLLLSLCPLIKKKFGLAILLTLLSLGFSLSYIFILGIMLMFTAFDAYEYEDNLTLKSETNVVLPPPTTMRHSPNFPDFELYRTDKTGEYLYQVFLTLPMEGKMYLKPFPSFFAGSEPNVAIQQSTLLDVNNPNQAITFENQQIYAFAQTKPFIMYDTPRWADYDVCLYLMFIPDDTTLPEKNFGEKCFNVQGAN